MLSPVFSLMSCASSRCFTMQETSVKGKGGSVDQFEVPITEATEEFELEVLE